MTDIEFSDTFDITDTRDVVIVQAVTGIDLQPQGLTQPHPFNNPGQFLCTLLRILCIRKMPGVDFHHRRTDSSSSFELTRIGIDEQ